VAANWTIGSEEDGRSAPGQCLSHIDLRTLRSAARRATAGPKAEPALTPGRGAACGAALIQYG